jgi:hypothetical protein
MDEDEGGHLGALPVAKVDEPTRESPLVEQLEIEPDSVRENTLPAADQDRARNRWYSSTSPALIASPRARDRQ